MGAIGARGLGVNVAFVNVVQPDFAGDLSRPVQGLWRRGWLVLQLEIRGGMQ